MDRQWLEARRGTLPSQESGSHVLPTKLATFASDRSYNYAQDWLDDASGTPRSCRRWLLLGSAALVLVLLHSLRLVIGPRPPLEPRNRQDLDRGRVTGPTAVIRTRLFQDFLQWVEDEDDPVQVAILLEEYGRVMYEHEGARRNYAETINFGPEIPIPENISGWALVALDDLEVPLTWKGPSPQCPCP